MLKSAIFTNDFSGCNKLSNRYRTVATVQSTGTSKISGSKLIRFLWKHVKLKSFNQQIYNFFFKEIYDWLNWLLLQWWTFLSHRVLPGLRRNFFHKTEWREVLVTLHSFNLLFITVPILLNFLHKIYFYIKYKTEPDENPHTT